MRHFSLATKGIIVFLSIYSALSCNVLSAEARPKNQFQQYLSQKISHPTNRKLPTGPSTLGISRDPNSDCDCSANNVRSMELTEKAWKVRESNPRKALILIEQAIQADKQNPYAWLVAAYLLRDSQQGVESLQVSKAIFQQKGDSEGLELIEQFETEYYS